MKRKIIIAIVVLVLSCLCGRVLFYIFESNIDKILFEIIFPGGNLYSTNLFKSE